MSHAPDLRTRLRFRFRLAALALLALAATGVHAQSAADVELRRALDAAARGQAVPAHMSRHPAYGWIEFTALRRNLATLPVAQADAFLQRYRGQPVAEAFREEWLRALHRRQDWAAIRAAWAPTIGNTGLRCIELDARHRLGAVDARWDQEVAAIWTSSGNALPDECNAPFAAASARGSLTPALRWQRLELAAAEWNPAVMRSAATGLPEAERALAEDYAAFVQAPHARAAQWPKTARSRLVASHGLAKLGRENPDAAEAQLPQVASALGFDEAERGRVLHQVALWTVASYLPGSAQRLSAVPLPAYDERLHEWQAREALSRSDWRAALAAIERMPATQRDSSRWSYFAARMHDLLGDRARAQPLYARAARDATFHGFLAADRLGQPYALCPIELPADASARARIANRPEMVRSMALVRADRPGWATREWNAALESFNDAERRLAVAVAQDNGWFDRAVFALGRQPEETRLYTLRFPLFHDELIRAEARRHNLDPAWIAAEIRAESTFNPRARSPADARGLMQVIPATGQAVARRLGEPWAGADSLYDPAVSIRLGTAYLREMKERYGLPYVAIAAYNAGPAPTRRWMEQRPGMDADLWIETISYRETREYVARVLAFSVIYDWRLHGQAAPLSERMQGRVDVARKPFACPAGSLAE
ncbi:lytic transglycosylase domain-containing protein [Luteimonas yindakuii]|uniref:Lytic transglycosylase domain-containing protein n=1 Tax=Luteimonas yindakuii TaxID=2565782 RepID=A0A4Z1REI6_9GAMM|nr:lytic transglycosylase domain-containing protein [Luteimonas yindakuii]TKS53087.1 lytic transglycosylase domain-containing protein [Luteimonas yindakuii]